METHYKAIHAYDTKVRMSDSEQYFYEFFVKGKKEVIKEIFFITDRDEKTIEALDALCEIAVNKTIDEILNLNISDIFKDEGINEGLTIAFSTLLEAVQSYSILLLREIHTTTLNDSELKQTPGDRRTIMVVSGKGGVGKSTVSLNIAVTLAKKGYKVGLVDVDIHGPSIPVMLNLPSVEVLKGENGIIPIILPDVYNLKVMSLGFMLEKADSPVVWRGPLKNQMIEQFLNDVDWGDIDYLIVDNPPGTGDEPLSTAQQLKGKGEALVVTTPQQVSTADVSRSINFCHSLSLPIVGLIENMSGFVCPHCNTTTHIFRSGGGEKLSKYYKVPLLGSIPLESNVGISGDIGIPYVQRFEHSAIAKSYDDICEKIVNTRSKKV